MITGMPAALAASTCGPSVDELTGAIRIASTLRLMNCWICEICVLTSIRAESHSRVAPSAVAMCSAPAFPAEMNELMS